ncbi:VWA domain-containing protein [Desulfovibrio sp. OttesenSCG-928-G11]|nr:VWA domain-containing protein [Desulfovibrio sp. OttesenSCG-928-G11]
MRTILSGLFLVFVLCLTSAAQSVAAAPTQDGVPAAAAGRTPLLLEGKKTLFQRVVSHPGAVLKAAPETGAPVTREKVKPFSVFYVYGEKNGYLEVGPSSNVAEGWVDKNQASAWPQAMTLLFTERSGRMPVLFFKEQKGLESICASDSLKGDLQKLLEKATLAHKNDDSGKDLPVLAAEPSDQEGAVARSRFYLMPIKHMSAPFEGVKFLEVASIDPGSGAGGGSGGAGAAGGSGGAGGEDGKSATMRTAIAFVIDSTISMKPYIDQSLNVVRSAFDNIEKQGLGDDVAFAVVAFRSSTAKDARVEYVTKKVSDFTTLSRRKELEDALSQVTEAPVSTPSFNEDSMAGVKAAVDELSWNDYHSRIIVLISDAGPLKPGDPLAASRMGPAEMLDYAKAKNIWLTVCHVRSPSGRGDHAYAEKAYRDLSRTSDGASSYMPINAPNPQTGAKSFASTARQLAESLSKVVKITASRKAPQPPAAGGGPLSPEDEARRIAESIGYAMQLDFIGRQQGNRAPAVLDAWIADMDLSRLADGQYSPTVEVAVLLTKNQLSDLQRTLQIIVDNADRTKKTDSRDFFQSVLSASAQMARDPAAFSAKPGQNLQETGVLGEFLEGLPYKSDIMLLREEDWYRMSVGEQTAFVNRLKSRIARYEEYDKDRSNWESFGAPNAGDWVYRVPLSVLP